MRLERIANQRPPGQIALSNFQFLFEPELSGTPMAGTRPCPWSKYFRAGRAEVQIRDLPDR
jgi:hypothetical protein